MPKITQYAPNDDGSYTLVIDGATLTTDDMRMLDNAFPLDADIEVLDGRRISIKQRKKIFALLNDIYNHTGQPQEDLRQTFMFYHRMIKGYEPYSLSDCSMTMARELIEIIIKFIFQEDIPLNFKTSDLLKDDRTFLFAATMNKNCVICGEKNSDLAHREAVGSGRNRKEISHVGMSVLALCRKHHTIQHQMGVDSFDEKYHLENSWLVVDERLDRMLRGQK